MPGATSEAAMLVKSEPTASTTTSAEARASKARALGRADNDTDFDVDADISDDAHKHFEDSVLLSLACARGGA